MIEPDDADEQRVTWKSDNTAVATVDANGTVTAVGKGMTTITATSVDGGYEAHCDIAVERRVMLHGNCPGGKVCLGGCITLTPSIGGGIWTYDPNAVSLHGNTFTTLKAGTTTVTYTLDGKGKKATFLQVLLGLLLRSASAENLEEVSFTITTEALTLTSSLPDGKTPLGSSFTLTPNFTGGTWDFDEAYVTRIGDTFYPRREGEVTVTYTYEAQTAEYPLMVYTSPLTGDGRPSPLPYAAGALLSALGMGFAALYRRRKHNPRP